MSAQLQKRIDVLEELLRLSREHAEALDRNWSVMHDAAMDAIRTALKMPKATVPAMVERIAQMRRDMEPE